jgi:C_GCAxxG_C_C family probable redox protein
MGGLCYGIGYSGEMCGALSGGACLISLVAGKGEDDESPKEKMPLMLSELVDWFREKVQGPYGSAKCDDILGANADKRPCMALIAETYDKAMSILKAHGIGLTGA